MTRGAEESEGLAVLYRRGQELLATLEGAEWARVRVWLNSLRDELRPTLQRQTQPAAGDAEAPSGPALETEDYALITEAQLRYPALTQDRMERHAKIIKWAQSQIEAGKA